MWEGIKKRKKWDFSISMEKKLTAVILNARLKSSILEWLESASAARVSHTYKAWQQLLDLAEVVRVS